MNTKIVYAAGIVILMIGIIFYFLNSGLFSSEDSSSSSLDNSNNSANIVNTSSSILSPSASPSSQPTSNIERSNYQNLTVSGKSIDIAPINNVSTVQVVLDVHNPNNGAAILETLSYGVYFDNVRLASADIGVKPEGFVDSLDSVYTIIGNQTITLRDKQPLTEDGISLFNPNGTLIQNSNSNISTTQITPNSYIINGTFSTTLNRGSNSQFTEIPFSVQIPLK
ncbi:MAG: hypothetical protein H0X03_03445 [Nitrosopumilus sp.]|nr:hypothetical protein [Nitrosopumilus sp.]